MPALPSTPMIARWAAKKQRPSAQLSYHSFMVIEPRLTGSPSGLSSGGLMSLGLNGGIVEYRAQRHPRARAAAQKDPSDLSSYRSLFDQGRATVADTRPQPDEEKAAPPPLLL